MVASSSIRWSRSRSTSALLDPIPLEGLPLGVQTEIGTTKTIMISDLDGVIDPPQVLKALSFTFSAVQDPSIVVDDSLITLLKQLPLTLPEGVW